MKKLTIILLFIAGTAQALVFTIPLGDYGHSLLKSVWDDSTAWHVSSSSADYSAKGSGSIDYFDASTHTNFNDDTVFLWDGTTATEAFSTDADHVWTQAEYEYINNRGDAPVVDPLIYGLASQTNWISGMDAGETTAAMREHANFADDTVYKWSGSNVTDTLQYSSNQLFRLSDYMVFTNWVGATPTPSRIPFTVGGEPYVDSLVPFVVPWEGLKPSGNVTLFDEGYDPILPLEIIQCAIDTVDDRGYTETSRQQFIIGNHPTDLTKDITQIWAQPSADWIEMIGDDFPSLTNHTYGTYTIYPNDDFTLDCDLSAIPIWNSYSYQRHSGMLITPRHIAVATHVMTYASLGTTFKFLGSDGVVYERTLTQKVVINGDLMLFELDSDLPSTVTPATVMPTIADYMSGYYAHGYDRVSCGVIPAWYLDQMKCLRHSYWYGSETDEIIATVIPSDYGAVGRGTNAVNNDSGSACFLVINNKPSLLFMFMIPCGVSSSYTPTAQLSAINAQILTWGNSTNQAAFTDLTGFRSTE